MVLELQKAREQNQKEFRFDGKTFLVRDFIHRFDVLFYQGLTYVPATSREALMKTFHYRHQGSFRLKHILKTKYYWTGMDKDIEIFLNMCEICNLSKSYVLN